MLQHGLLIKLKAAHAFFPGLFFVIFFLIFAHLWWFWGLRFWDWGLRLGIWGWGLWLMGFEACGVRPFGIFGFGLPI